MTGTFTKKDLETGDIVILRNGEMGVVLTQIDQIMYQNMGMNFLDEFTEELLYDSGYDGRLPEYDIMEVRRGSEGVPPSFLLCGLCDLVFERAEEADEAEEVQEDVQESVNEEFAAYIASWKEKREKEYLTIMTQAFYGNRTMTQIAPENMDRFILGYQTSDIQVIEPIDRTIVPIPGSDCLVLVYNRYAEEKRLRDKEKYLREENYELRPLAVIPELDLKLYSRCIALRMNKDGSFASLREGDDAVLTRYLAG